MQALANHLCLAHKLPNALLLDDDMCASQALRLIQPPDVQLVHAEHAGNAFEIFLDVHEVHAWWCALEQDVAGATCQWDSGRENHERNVERDGRVDVEAVGRMREPDDKRGDDDADVVEGIAHDVDHGPEHAEIAVLLRREHIGVVVGDVGWVSKLMASLLVMGMRMSIGMVMAMSMAMSVIMSVAMVVLMQKYAADEIQGQTDASYNQHNLGLFDLFDIDEAFYGLEADGQAEGE